MGPGFTGNAPPKKFEENSCENCYRGKIMLVAFDSVGYFDII